MRLRAAPDARRRGLGFLLWQFASGPLGGASLELLIAARHDPDMRDYLKPLEREFARANLDLCKALLGEQRAGHKRFPEFCMVVINSMLGAAASKPGHGSAEEKRLLEAWRRIPDLYFAPDDKRRVTAVRLPGRRNRRPDIAATNRRSNAATVRPRRCE